MNSCAIAGKTLLDQLIKQGVTYFVLAPGFRSTPMVMAVAEDRRAEVVVHFDERGAAFHALGYAKATGKPACVIVTSGTAVGNLMPAVMEAASAEVPLILLTCDRPHELRDTGANQTADQIKIFGNFVRYQFDFPRTLQGIPDRFFATTVARGVLKSQYPLPGPIQFNLPFPEPFLDNDQANAIEMEPVQFSIPKLKSEEEMDLGDKKGVIILGSGGSCKEASDLAKKLNFPIFADIISGHRELADPNSVAYYHHILKSIPDIKVDTIIHIGGAYVSKTLLNWVAKQPEVIHISNSDQRIDPHHVVKKRLFSCESISGQYINGWLEKWKSYEEAVEPNLGDFSEPAIIQSLLKSKDALFFANSMPIRDADMFYFPKEPRPALFANRGLSGIDGNIATICGIAHQMPVTAVVGDQTLLHDLNSLTLLKKTKHRVKLIVINNGGGGIFSFVVIGKGENLLNDYFAAAHDQTFEKIASGFGLSYEKANSLDQVLNSKCDVIEVITNREENYALHLEIDHQFQDALCSSFSTVS